MSSLAIYQIYYDEFSKKELFPFFIPYDNSKVASKWYEYGVFRQNFLNKKYKAFEYTGFVSWKFQGKTNISGREFIKFIENHSGYDVYFINPFQGNTYRFKNVWECGDFFHPGLMEIVDYIFRNLNYNIDINKMVNSNQDTLYSNYWVGNEKWWNLYMEFCEPIYSFIETSGDSFIHERILKEADSGNKASFIPFIMERMFSTVIFNQRHNLRVIPYSYKSYKRYPISLYPVYRKLEKLKLIELAGGNIEAERKSLIPYLDSFSKLVIKEQNTNAKHWKKIINRVIVLIQVLWKLFLSKK